MVARTAEQRIAAPVLRMNWLSLTFVHWAYPPQAVQRLLPPGLTVDERAGRAWVGMTPFLMSDIRLAGCLPLPGPATFAETNLRTYVHGPHGRDGLWFFSLEATRALVVTAAITLLGAPYRLGRLGVRETSGRVDYTGCRRNGDAAYRLRLRPGEPVVPSDLEVWLTSRWRAYTRHAGRLWETPVEHEAWPLRSAVCEGLAQSLTDAAGLPPPAYPPLLHFSGGVRNVRIGTPRPAR